MCNLSQGIKEDGIAIGEKIGEARGEARIIINMHNSGFTVQQNLKLAKGVYKSGLGEYNSGSWYSDKANREKEKIWLVMC